MDFISYWAASVLALGGNAAGAYDIQVHKAVQDGVALFDPLMPFPYPPPFLVMIFPIGLLPYAVAPAVWIAGTYALYFAAAKRLFPNSGWLVAAFPPVLLNAIMRQNGLLTAAFFIGGALFLPKRPFVAGLLFGCLIKPQLGLLLPFAFIAGRSGTPLRARPLLRPDCSCSACCSSAPAPTKPWRSSCRYTAP